jgi:hypothetical protein
VAAALLLWGTGGDPSRADAVTLYTDGSWLEQVGQRLEWFPLYRAEAVFILPLSVATFLIGSQLMRAGLFEQRGRALRRRMMALGLGIALPIDLAIGSLGGAAGLVFARYATAPLVAAGLLGAAACLVELRRSPGAVRRRLADVGRTALSCYVLQNIICSALCYGWGFGLAAGMGNGRTWWTLLLYAAVCTLVIALAIYGCAGSRKDRSRPPGRGPTTFHGNEGNGDTAAPVAVRGGPRRIAAFGDSDGAEPVVPSGSYNQGFAALSALCALELARRACAPISVDPTITLNPACRSRRSRADVRPSTRREPACARRR